MKKLFCAASAVVLGLVSAPALAAPLDVPAAKAEVAAVLDRDYGQLDALYKDLHAHPELGFQEKRTAAKLAAEMRSLGLEVTEGVGGTGVVAVLKNGAGPSVLVRTELDALPMEEKTGLPYASRAMATWNGKDTFVAHSCGHDVHMAAWIGTARALIASKARWSGTVIFVAQPSEETVNGAKAMLDDGFIKRFGKADYGFALHVGPGLAGQVYYKPGAVSSTSDGLDVVFTGRGGHGSMPASTIDPVMMGSRFVVDVQSVISREKDPAAFGVVTVGSFQAGSAGNIIPDSAHLRGTIRTQDGAVRDKIISGVNRTANAVADMAGAPAPTVTIAPGGKAVINDAELTERTAKVFQAAFGDNAVVQPQAGSASEDYSEFIIAGTPSVYFGIGGFDAKTFADAQKPGAALPVNHSPFFAPVPEPSIRTGVMAMSLAVMNVASK
ncbi:peptidase M20 [Phenylobacterium sp. Root77]|uniref:amidohydrolase n=1 Tax=unclassified Phenylobacterium TaxID=2640670 RepID=UPI0006FEB06B|nr:MULTISPECIES: amidohydrolase [unclassified Phenylobacterium]KQW71880.1 peptidase M20 [Phenylobacterium sp. Root1277]KQW94800.1 peptidase M20 [Phenylobacterium sp. Root1290]KRC44493.1 peptidase M20 [Phenylobacterium sp. Root77]